MNGCTGITCFCRTGESSGVESSPLSSLGFHNATEPRSSVASTGVCTSGGKSAPLLVVANVTGFSCSVLMGVCALSFPF